MRTDFDTQFNPEMPEGRGIVLLAAIGMAICLIEIIMAIL